MADRLADVAAKTLGDKLIEVNSDTLLNDLPYWPVEVEPERISKLWLT